MIKGWKHAGSDITKARREASNAAKSVKLVRANKDGSESGMHDATSHFSSEEEAHKHHHNLRSLNPTRNIRHHLYVDGQHKGILDGSSQHDEQLEAPPVGHVTPERAEQFIAESPFQFRRRR